MDKNYCPEYSNKAQGTIEEFFGKIKQKMKFFVKPAKLCFAREFSKKSIAQGTIEYLVIVGIVVLLSLVVVGLVLTQTDSGTNSVSVANKIAMKSSGIAISEAVSGEDGNLFLNFTNNLGETITVTGLVIDGVEYVGYNEILAQGSTRAFVIHDLEGCDGTTTTYTVQIQYTSGEGLPKYLDYGEIEIDCTPVVTPVVPIVDEPITPVETTPIFGITFNVQDLADESELNGVDVTCDASEYDASNQDYGFIIDFNEGTYTCDFSKDGYDSNTDFSVVADENKTYTILLTEPESPLNQGISFGGNTPSNGNTLDVNYFDVNIDSNISSAHYIFNNLDSSLVGWWRGENGANDSSGNNNNGSWIGTPAYTDGNFGRAFSLSGGTDDYVDVERDGLPSGSGPLTVSAWIKTTQSDTGCDNRGEGYFFALGLRAPGAREFVLGVIHGVFAVENYGGSIEGSTTINDGEWHHVVGVWNGNEALEYVDGGSESLSRDELPAIDILDTGHLLIGSPYSSCYPYTGSLDEVMLFNRVLSASEIRSLYDAQVNEFNVNYSDLNNGDHNFISYAVNGDGNLFTVDGGLRTVTVSTGAIELDNMEYDSNASAQTAYLSNADFNDNFSGDLSRWTTLSGSWSISGGALYKGSSCHCVEKVSSVNALNGIVESKINGVNLNYNGVVFRVQNDSNYYYAVLHPDGVNGCEIMWLKRINGADTIIYTLPNSLPVCWPSTRNYILKVVYSTEGAGIRAKMYLDNNQTPIMDYLETPASIPLPGSVGARSYSSGITWDDFNFIGSLTRISESTIKNQGSYSLKVIADANDSLDKNITHNFATLKNLSGKTHLTFDIRASRTGSNIKVGIHDTNGATTEVTPNITVANIWQSVDYDISGVSNANKDTIDKLIITIVNADTQNTFYIDNVMAS
jgi:hypothetical protein